MTENSSQTLEKIVSSAIVLFDKHGYSGTSISEIGKNAELSKGILYYYFKSKDELYIHCAKKCMDEFTRYLDDNLVNAPKNEDSIILFLQYRLEFFKNNPKYRNLLYNIFSHNPEHLQGELGEIRKTFQEKNLERFISYVEFLKLGKDVSKDDCVNFMLLLQNSSSFTLDSMPNFDDVEKQEQAIINITKIYINGLKEDLT